MLNVTVKRCVVIGATICVTLFCGWLAFSAIAQPVVSEPNSVAIPPPTHSGTLPIPPLQTGQLIDGVRTYDLEMITGTTEFTPGIGTPTMGYNGTFLGPTLVLTRGESVQLNVTNHIGAHTTTHWHGLHLPAIMDGGPHQGIMPGATWSPTFTMLNRAALYWFHPHPHASGAVDPNGTGAQVYNGLAGLMIVRDDTSIALDLPKTYGIDDFPLIVQDRGFNPDGTFRHFPSPTGPFFRKGDVFLVNGAISPTMIAPAQMVRLRILNASNTRIYNFGFSDNRTFFQIGSDGGFLETPTPRSRLLLAPGERAEIVVDFGGDEGSSVEWMAYNSGVGTTYVPPFIQDEYDTTDFAIFTIDIGPPTPNPVTALPGNLTTIDRFSAEDAVNSDTPRQFVLQAGAMINGVKMDMDVINEYIRLNDIEIWEITNTSVFAHPFHVHDDAFQILSRNGVAPPAHEMGWKDTVIVKPGENVKLIRIFEDFADSDLPYMYHCHLLEHEDAGMMGQFVVVEDFLEPDLQVEAPAGTTVVFTHTLTHPGSGANAEFALEAASDADWEVTIDPATPVLLAARQSQEVTLSVSVPISATVGTIDTSLLVATIIGRPDITAATADTITIVMPEPTPTSTATSTATPTPTNTATPQSSPTPTPTGNPTASLTPTSTATSTPTMTATPLPTTTSTATATPTTVPNVPTNTLFLPIVMR
ncbi:MAG: multicopper oxidase domain-containing protein [Anaerolineae bacterium]|nr:multicopper oxidase domain-containing protein [Anaerolineae bacterium]